jgi:hypothetical protein
MTTRMSPLWNWRADLSDEYRVGAGTRTTCPGCADLKTVSDALKAECAKPWRGSSWRAGRFVRECAAEEHKRLARWLCTYADLRDPSLHRDPRDGPVRTAVRVKPDAEHDVTHCRPTRG